LTILIVKITRRRRSAPLLLLSIADKEARGLADGCAQADRQSGGDVLYFRESGRAAERSLHIGLVYGLLERVQAALTRSKALLELPGTLIRTDERFETGRLGLTLRFSETQYGVR
jgi:hypothetical protein